MANIKSQLKDIVQNEKRRQQNIAVRSAIKTYSKKALATAGTDEARENLNLALKSIDKAVSRGVIKKNTGARKKSLLMRTVLNEKTTPPPAAEEAVEAE